MKKILLSGFVIVTFSFYALHQRFGEDTPVIYPNNPAPTVIETPTPTPTPNSSATPPPQGNGMMGTGMGQGMMQGQYKNGTYTGSVADAFYGNVQVAAVIRGGKITDVQFLQYPNDRGTSIYINQQAMPMLTQEAIAAQSANVSGVSGASETSRAFIESLTNALSQAK